MAVLSKSAAIPLLAIFAILDAVLLAPRATSAQTRGPGEVQGCVVAMHTVLAISGVAAAAANVWAQADHVHVDSRM